jgi:hypothetical protein
MRRQRLLSPIAGSEDVEDYLALFKLLQPVSPVYFTRPGDPPRLVHRTKFDDFELSSDLRAKHRYVKGKFLGGRVGYVLNYPAGEISKALQALQEAFIVYEDQTDTDWDTGWFDFATEWFEIQDEPLLYHRAVSSVIIGFLKSMVFASMDQIRSWSQINRKTIHSVIDTLLHEGLVVRAEVPDMREGYMLKEDSGNLPPTSQSQTIPKFVLMLDKSEDDEVETRKNEILDAVRTVYSSGSNPIVRYNGTVI